MTYATRTDLEERYGAAELTQRETMLAAGAVARALADADVEIDSYCTGRYAVPFSPVPGNITRVAAAIARYRILGDSATEIARKEYEDARAWLREVATGRVQIEGSTPLAAAAPSATVDYVVGRDKAFTGGIQ